MNKHLTGRKGSLYFI